MMARRSFVLVALVLAVLMPMRGFAAHLIASCVSSTGEAQLVSMQVDQTESMPCHEMGAQDDDANCALRCSACAASCAAPAFAPHEFSADFSLPFPTHQPAAEVSFQSASLVRLDKPPVLQA